MTYRLLDTNIVSYMVTLHSLYGRYRPHLRGFQLAIAFQTYAELWTGVELRNWGADKRRQLTKVLAGILVLQSDELICHNCAAIRTAR